MITTETVGGEAHCGVGGGERMKVREEMRGGKGGGERESLRGRRGMPAAQQVHF